MRQIFGTARNARGPCLLSLRVRPQERHLKHEYFADINDYRKYGLLRCCADAGFRVGICWMLTPDVGNGDGRKTAYLRAPMRWRRYDPALFDVLAESLDGSSVRSVEAVERSSLILRAKYFSSILHPQRLSRLAYFASALKALASCDLLFFDPDNGLEVKSVPFGTSASPKYIYWSEVREAWNSGASLLLFQHFTREARESFVQRITSTAAEKTGGRVVTVRSDHVVFLFVLQRSHEDLFEASAGRIRERWAGQLVLDTAV